MPQAISSIDIYLPLDYNDGSPIPETRYISLQRELLGRFRGVTSVQRQFPLQGLWQSGGEVYQDRVVVFNVMDFRRDSQFERFRYLEKLRGRLKKKFGQLDVLITVADLLAV